MASARSTIVVDASVAFRLLLPCPESDAVQELWAGWVREGCALYAPAHWQVEITSGLRRLTVAGELAAEEAHITLEGAYRLGVERVPTDVELCRTTLAWAARLGQTKTYDAAYLALAERLGADLWTADPRLARGAQQSGVTWVRGLPSAPAVILP